MVPVSRLENARPRFGGKIWIDPYGSCSYDCALCGNRFFSAGSFEFHITMVHRHEMKTNALVQSGQNHTTQSSFYRERDSEDAHSTTNRISHTKTYNELSDRKHGQHDNVSSDLICPKCNKRFVSLSLLRKHVLNHHKFKCIHCPRDTTKSFETQQGLRLHQRNQHDSIFCYKCKVCPQAFERREELQKHKQSKHARGNDVKCDFCPKMLMSVFEKENHIKKEHSNRRYYCFLCTEYWSTSEKNVRRHTKEKHPGQSQPNQ